MRLDPVTRSTKIEFGTTVTCPGGRAGITLQRSNEEGEIMSLQSRLESLKDRHATLEMRITEEDLRPRPDSGTLFTLKVEKLRLKEEMDRLERQPH